MILLTACAGSDAKVNASVSVTVEPAVVTLTSGASQSFAATVKGSSNTTVRWSIEEGAAGGAISASGLYVAPADAGTYHVVATSEAGASATATVAVTAPGTPFPAMPVISFGVPAYASSEQQPASGANDGTQNGYWQSAGMAPQSYGGWLAYDLSGVDASARQTVFVSWWSPPTYGYDASESGASYGLPGAYVLEGNSAPGSTGNLRAAPMTGWVQLYDVGGQPVSVTGNVLNGREHLVNLQGMNWIRFRATAGCAYDQLWQGEDSISIAMDVHDASRGLDAWNFVGDSITGLFQVHATGTGSAPSGFAEGNFSQLIHGGVPGLFAGNASYRPAFNGNGEPGTTAAGWTSMVANYLPLWPSPCVGIQLGANDAGNDPSAFYAHMVSIVTALVQGGKVVFVATPSWQSVAMGHQDMSQLAAQVPAIVAHFAALGEPVYAGPDMYAFFSQAANQGYIAGNDGLHPDAAGQAIMRNLWAETAFATRY